MDKITADFIDKLTALVSKHDEIEVGELMDNPTFTYQSIGEKVVANVETLRKKDVGITVYVDDIEVDWFDVPYEELPEAMLEQMLELVEMYDVELDKTFKRCED